ncbi:MAG: hypothetical protein ABIN93_10965 [Ginsengibacter sp.]
MNYRQTNRRSFISSIAILSAGAAFGSANNFFPAGKSTVDLQGQWSSFWKQNGGNPFYESFQFEGKSGIRCCKGHIHKTGRVIYFSNEDMLAQPTWVYWGREKSKPDDVIITFFENGQQKKKIFRINRFELESVHALTADKDITNLLKTLKAVRTGPLIDNSENSLKISTIVRNGHDVRISVRHAKKQITIRNKLIYNT